MVWVSLPPGGRKLVLKTDTSKLESQTDTIRTHTFYKNNKQFSLPHFTLALNLLT